MRRRKPGADPRHWSWLGYCTPQLREREPKQYRWMLIHDGPGARGLPSFVHGDAARLRSVRALAPIGIGYPPP